MIEAVDKAAAFRAELAREAKKQRKRRVEPVNAPVGLPSPRRGKATPKQIDAHWERFLKQHGHLDEDGRIIHTERLQREVGFAGMAALYYGARHGDIRSAEVLVRTCLATPRAPLEVRVTQMSREQLQTREKELLAELPASMRADVEAALTRAALPALEGEKR